MRTRKPLTVGPLYRAGDEILWDESVVIICQGKVYPIPGHRMPADAVLEPVTLGPNETITTTVNALTLEGPEWPRGGYRIEFQFCLGEQSAVQSFYYLSRHHDGVRAKLLKAAGN